MYRAPTTAFFAPTVVALAALAVLALVAWGASPYGRYLSHDGIEEAGPAFPFVFVAGWTLMIVAMMLPTSLPLVALFDAMTRGRPDRVALLALLTAGYVGVWTAFGALMLGADAALHAVVRGAAFDGTLVVAGVLVAAGAYQFTPLKRACLSRCRSPKTFLVSRWTGQGPRRDALRLGVEHGAYCVGCCWSLMVVMLAVGVGSVAWMLGLGALMAVEKNAAWGRWVGPPVGAALLVGGAGLAAGALA